MEMDQNSSVVAPLDLYLANSLFPFVDLTFETSTGRYLIVELVGVKVLSADQLVADTDHCGHNGELLFYLEWHAAESGGSL